MDNALRDRLMHAMFRFKKVGMIFPPGLDIHMGELFVMRSIDGTGPCPEHNNAVSDLPKHMMISKPAMSQLLNGLEKKGYISREIDKSDRRKISAALTPKGEEVLAATKAYADEMLDTVIARFGEENLLQLLALFTRLTDISEEVRQEMLNNEEKGDNALD
jgi:DNA-binding MarR family transcriptional regulator